MGTPSFAVPVLRSLVENGNNVVGVVTKPAKPSGRGMKMIGSDIEKVALELGLNIIQPTSAQDNQEMLQQLTSLAPDIVVSAAYGLFLLDQKQVS